MNKPKREVFARTCKTREMADVVYGGLTHAYMYYHQTRKEYIVTTITAGSNYEYIKHK